MKRVTAKCHSATGILGRVKNELCHSKTAFKRSRFPGQTRLPRDFAVESASPDRKMEPRAKMASQ